MLRSRKKHKGLRTKRLLLASVGSSLIHVYIYCAYFCSEMLFLKLYPEGTLQSVHNDLTRNMFTGSLCPRNVSADQILAIVNTNNENRL